MRRSSAARPSSRSRGTHAWIIDPSAKTLEVYQRRGDVFALVSTFDGTAAVRAEPFDACELNLGALWIDGAQD